MFSLTQFSALSEILAFISLAFCLVCLVAIINCLWRAHKMLATFIWLCFISMGIYTCRKILDVLGYNTLPNWVVYVQWFDLFQSFFFMMAAIEFYRIIRRLDGEESIAKNGKKEIKR